MMEEMKMNDVKSTNAVEIEMEKLKKMYSEEQNDIEKEEQTANCCYYECINDGFCTICGKQCNGRISTINKAAKVVDYSKMCLMINARDNHKGSAAENPVLFYISKTELERMLNSSGVAHLRLILDKKMIPSDGDINLFVAITSDEEKGKIKK